MASRAQASWLMAVKEDESKNLQVGISDEHSRSNQLALVDTLAKIAKTVKEVKNEKRSVDPKVYSGHDNVNLGLAQ
jgi:hypothetical protein